MLAWAYELAPDPESLRQYRPFRIFSRPDYQPESDNLAKTNFQYEKRQKELEKKRKKEEKLKRKADKDSPSGETPEQPEPGEGDAQSGDAQTSTP
jgi:hypothetical protein